MKQMKTLTIRGTQYEIVDNATRTQLTEIVGKIAEIESGSISTEVIEQAISDYLVENPIEGLTIEEVAEYIQEHIEEFKGETGDDGASAYQIAVNNGFSGTEVEWLASLKGADGEKGNTGETGADGNGIVSVAKTGTSSLVDTYTITYSDGTSTTFNVTNGSNGTDGKSAYEIAVENGYNGTENEWLISLKGEDGSDGVGISDITKSGETVTITLTDNTTKTFEVENGEDLTTQGVENTNSGTVSITLSPNVFCLLSDTETGISDLTITLANGNFYDEYMCAFTTSSEGCNLTMPSTIEWLGDTPTLEASTYYELSIKNNKAVIA